MNRQIQELGFIFTAMIIKTKGIIFRAVKYSETSFITDIYTEEKGLRTYIVSGVRSKKAKVKPSLLQVMTLVDIVAYFREDKEMNRIKEIKATRVYSSIPFDITKSAVGLFMIELARKTILEKEENQQLFQFLFDVFYYLDSTDNSVSNLHLSFCLKLSSFLGFMPGGKYQNNISLFDIKEGIFIGHPSGHTYYMDEEQSYFLYLFLTGDLQKSHEIKMTRIQRKNFLIKLLDFYRFHVENFSNLNAHQILQEVLS